MLVILEWSLLELRQHSALSDDVEAVVEEDANDEKDGDDSHNTQVLSVQAVGQRAVSIGAGEEEEHLN
jgi:hypothetical protein